MGLYLNILNVFSTGNWKRNYQLTTVMTDAAIAGVSMLERLFSTSARAPLILR